MYREGNWNRQQNDAFALQKRICSSVLTPWHEQQDTKWQQSFLERTKTTHALPTPTLPPPPTQSTAARPLLPTHTCLPHPYCFSSFHLPPYARLPFSAKPAIPPPTPPPLSKYFQSKTFSGGRSSFSQIHFCIYFKCPNDICSPLFSEPCDQKEMCNNVISVSI